MDDDLRILLYLSAAIWLLPIIKQKNTKFALFFLFIGIDDVLAIAFYFLIYPNTYLVIITANYLAFLTFFRKEHFKKGWYFFLVIYLLMAIGWFVTDDWRYHAVMQGLTFVYLLFGLGYEFILELVERRFSFSILILISYAFTFIFTAVVATTIEYKYATIHLYFATFVEIIYGFFFTTFRIDDERLIGKL
ncbi:MAG: hypothetical protein PVH88_26275 [Ignavibacteria bacterium]|jgi:hypothetical protein